MIDTIQMPQHKVLAVDDSVKVVEATDQVSWKQYSAAHAWDDLSFRFEWDAVFGVYGLHVLRLAAMSDERITGILPLVLQRSRIFGTQLVSLPWFDAAGIVADNEPSKGALVHEAVAIAQRLGARRIVLRQPQPIEGWSVERDDKVIMHLPLESESDKLWKRFDPKVRNQVRKAEKSGLTAASGGAELLDDFFRIYAFNMRDLGSPSHARGFFAAVLANFPTDAKIHVVRLNDRIIGAGLTIANGTRLDIPWASSLQEFNRLCVNHLLYWHILRNACQDGFSCFNYGRSTKGSGQHHFKRQWGAEELPLYWYAFDGAGREIIDTRPPQSEFGTAIRIWRKMPLWFTRWVGPKIIRQVP